MKIPLFSNQVPELSSKVLSTLSIFLGLPHVHVRKTTATKLYEALILHADACGVPEENLDEVIGSELNSIAKKAIPFYLKINLFEVMRLILMKFVLQIMNLLSETDWGQSITEIRLIRNTLCTLLNIKPPVTAAK